jgi:DNA-binding transcriptional regulator LsrR (DeoR family)
MDILLYSDPMKLIDRPKYGPLFRFSDYHVYKTLSLLADGRRKGRKQLADRIGVGEGSMRTIVDYLREEGFVDIKQTGIKITKKGQEYISKFPLQVYVLEVPDLTLGLHSVAVQVKGVSNKIKSGIEQRDQAIKAGAEGATTVVVKGDRLTVPVDFDLDKDRPEVAQAIRRLFDLSDGDVIIIGTSTDLQKAEEGALAATFELL